MANKQKSSCTLDALISHLTNGMETGSQYSISAPITTATVEADSMTYELFSYLSEHEFCVKTKFDRIEDDVVYSPKLVFNIIDVVELETGVI